MQNTGHNTVTLLFEEGGFDILTAGVLATFLAVYFLIAMITVGIPVPHGMVIPTLVIGGSLGRLCGVLWNSWGLTGAIPLDPGACAQMGAAAFWSGSGRITVTIAIIVLEITGEFSWLPAIGVTVVFAKWTGDYFNHGVYHSLIHLKNLPFLEEASVGALHGMTAADVMSSPVQKIELLSRVDIVRDLLKRTTHNGFPVVDSLHNGGRLVGVARRRYLAPWCRDDADGNEVLRLEEIMTSDPHFAMATVPASQAATTFRMLGLRHLPVVDEKHTVVGIICRRNLVDATQSDTGGIVAKTSSSLMLNDIDETSA